MSLCKMERPSGKSSLLDKEEGAYSTAVMRNIDSAECCKNESAPTKNALQMQAPYLPVTSVLSLRNDKSF